MTMDRTLLKVLSQAAVSAGLKLFLDIVHMLMYFICTYDLDFEILGCD